MYILKNDSVQLFQLKDLNKIYKAETVNFFLTIFKDLSPMKQSDSIVYRHAIAVLNLGKAC